MQYSFSSLFSNQKIKKVSKKNVNVYKLLNVKGGGGGHKTYYSPENLIII